MTKSTIRCKCGEVLNISPYVNADLQLICDDLAAKLVAAEVENEALEQKLAETESRQSPLEDSVTDLGGQLAESREQLATARGLLREVLATAGQWEYLPKYGIVMTQDWLERTKKEVGDE